MRQNELRSTFSSLLLLSVISIVFLVKTSNSQHCGSVFKAGQGSFWSPGYNAAGYSANSNCVWTITTTPGKLIKFGFFQAFDVEESSHCRMDYVAIYDGIEQSERTLLGRYCGVFQAPLLLSMSDKMTIELRSDYKTNGNGFLGSWISEEPSSYTTNQNLGLCGGIIEPGLNRKFMQNEITSMGYPKKEYRNRNACLWEFRLNRESMKGVEFRVGGIDIEHSPGCRFDHLSVFNRTMVTGEQGVFAKTDTGNCFREKWSKLKKLTFSINFGTIPTIFPSPNVSAGKTQSHHSPSTVTQFSFSSPRTPPVPEKVSV